MSKLHSLGTAACGIIVLFMMDDVCSQTTNYTSFISNNVKQWFQDTGDEIITERRESIYFPRSPGMIKSSDSNRYECFNTTSYPARKTVTSFTFNYSFSIFPVIESSKLLLLFNPFYDGSLSACWNQVTINPIEISFSTAPISADRCASLGLSNETFCTTNQLISSFNTDDGEFSDVYNSQYVLPRTPVNFEIDISELWAPIAITQQTGLCLGVIIPAINIPNDFTQVNASDIGRNRCIDYCLSLGNCVAFHYDFSFQPLSSAAECTYYQSLASVIPQPPVLRNICFIMPTNRSLAQAINYTGVLVTLQERPAPVEHISWQAIGPTAHLTLVGSRLSATSEQNLSSQWTRPVQVPCQDVDLVGETNVNCDNIRDLCEGPEELRVIEPGLSGIEYTFPEDWLDSQLSTTAQFLCGGTCNVTCPTAAPTTASPTIVPTAAPTIVPTEAPTYIPSALPSELPSQAPTLQPSEIPTPSFPQPATTTVSSLEGGGGVASDSLTMIIGIVCTIFLLLLMVGIFLYMRSKRTGREVPNTAPRIPVNGDIVQQDYLTPVTLNAEYKTSPIVTNQVYETPVAENPDYSPPSESNQYSMLNYAEVNRKEDSTLPDYATPAETLARTLSFC